MTPVSSEPRSWLLTVSVESAARRAMGAATMSIVDNQAGLASDPVVARYLNRELSWLNFNARVLAQATDPRLPLLERFKFCAIYAANLDEFFQVRVAGLREQVAAGVFRASPDGLSPLAQLQAIRREVLAQARELERVEIEELLPALAREGVEVIGSAELTPDEAKRAAYAFEHRIFPVLTPLAVDPAHPFPYISNLSLSLAVLLDDSETESVRFARVKVPDTLARFVEVGEGRLVPVEQVIACHLDQLFPGVEVVGAWPFRVTRNADLTVDDEDADDLLEAIELELRRRRFGRAVRLETTERMPADAMELLLRALDLEEHDVYTYQGLLDLSGFWQLQGLDRADLKVAIHPGVVPRRLRDIEDSRDLFARIQRADIVVHHPYESFGASVTELIRQAAADPAVLTIKMTLYRTSGDSPIVESLIAAGERGKQVAVLVELKARFDEEANITWARRLEEAGVHVAYGLVGLKIHAKTTLVVRNEPEGLRRYCHIGTGNYNPKTAQIYEDIGVLTADPVVGDDVSQLFNFLTGFSRHVRYDRLLVAPQSLRHQLEQLIDTEFDAPAGTGRIILKMNSLVDARLIDRLYAASAAGVEIDLIVRGICCLRAGVPGLSDNIRVRSMVGRYLEHSRICYFANGGGPGVAFYFIGSADLMPRNLDRRVEVLARIDDPASQARLWEVLQVNLADTALTWALGPDDHYRRLAGKGHGDELNAHDRFEQLAAARSQPPDAVSVEPALSEIMASAAPARPHGQGADMTIHAAGCLPWRRGTDGIEVLLAHRGRYDDWTFPKGKREPGESDLDCAVRETAEETGLRGEIGPELPSTAYQAGGRPKVVRYWLLEVTGGAFEANDEVDEIRWLSVTAAAALLTYHHDRELLGRVPALD
jgi:polyphosphate kinase